MTNEQAARMLMKTISQFKRMSKHQGLFGGLKPSEIGLLHVLKDRWGESPENGMRISELSEKLRVTPPSITQIVTSLEGTGMVMRRMDRGDRRSVLVNLTDEGRKATDRAYEHYVSIFTGLVEHLGVERSLVLNELLDEAINYMTKISM